jgi:hypothetical protein
LQFGIIVLKIASIVPFIEMKVSTTIHIYTPGMASHGTILNRFASTRHVWCIENCSLPEGASHGRLSIILVPIQTAITCLVTSASKGPCRGDRVHEA